MNCRALFISLCMVGLMAQAAAGQAWVQPAGSVYTKLFYGYTAAVDQYSFDGTVRPYADNVTEDAYMDQSLYLYAEIGLTNALTFFATVPYKRVTVHDTSFRYRTTAVGSANAGFSISLKRLVGGLQSRNALSVTAEGSIPTGYTRNFAPSAGSGQVDAAILLAFGRSFYPAPLYFQMSGGYQHRSGIYRFSEAKECQAGQDLDCVHDVQPDFDDQFLYSAELGVDIANRILLQALVGGVWSVSPPETGFSVYNPYPTRQRYVKAGAGLRIALPGGIGVSGQMRLTPYGANTIKSVDYFVGIDLSFRLNKCCNETETTTTTEKKQETKKRSAAAPFSKPHQRRY